MYTRSRQPRKHGHPNLDLDLTLNNPKRQRYAKHDDDNAD